MSVLVKICGITNVRDAERALEAGADWIGLNLVGGPRKITWGQMWKILEECRGMSDERYPFVALVDAGKLQPDEPGVLKAFGIFRLQVYGAVSEAISFSLAAHDFETIAVRHVGSESALRLEYLPNYVLLDAAVDPKDGQLGGTGRLADWSAIELARQEDRFEHWPPIILAGGLNADNIEEAIRRVKPWGVDVSSGVESEPGIKDPRKMERFVQLAKNAG